MFSQRDPNIRKSGYANVFIKNLDPAIDNKALHETFAAFGSILSSKVATDRNGQAKGFGYVQFEKEEDAQNAIQSLHGMLITDKQVYVGKHIRRPCTGQYVTKVQTRCFGFVNFKSPDAASAAVEKLNGTINDYKVVVCRKGSEEIRKGSRAESQS
ncbi:hypothetical protein DITRI_Ditri05aG0161700 [Diplodiscus trichospermus]